MGTFEKIRRMSKYFFFIFAFLLIAYFVWNSVSGGVSGNDNVFKQGESPQNAAIAYVNGEKILYSEFNKLVNEQLENRRKQAKDENTDIDETAIRQQVFNQMVNEVLLKQEAKKAGTIVTDDEIRDILYENPPDFLKRQFPDSVPGKYNRELYLRLIKNPEDVVNFISKDISDEEKAKTVQSLRSLIIAATDQIKTQKLMEGLMSVLGTSQSMISPIAAKKTYIDDNSNADLLFMAISPNFSVQNDIKISDDDIKAYYEKNKQYYKQKETRKIKYVNFPMVPSHDDTLFALNNVGQIAKSLSKAANENERYEKFEGLLTQFLGNRTDFKHKNDCDPILYDSLSSLKEHGVGGPYLVGGVNYFLRIDEIRTSGNPVVRASHILISNDIGKDSAKAKALEIIKKLKEGEDFSKLAIEYSKDPGSKDKGGDLGWFKKGTMVKEFDSAAFVAAVGEIVGPVETQFGFHIIKVFERDEKEIKYSEIKIRPLMSDQTKNNIKVTAVDVKRDLEKGVPFDEIGKKINKQVNESQFFEKSTPVLGSYYLCQLAFSNEIGKALEQIELKHLGIIVAQVSDARKEGIASLEDKKTEIQRKLFKIKKLDQIKPRAEEVYKLVLSGGMEAASRIDSNYFVRHATIKNNAMIPGFGMDASFTSEAFKLQAGQISKLIRGERAYYIIKLNSKNIPPDNKDDAAFQNYYKQVSQDAKKQSYNQWYGDLESSPWFKKLRNEAKIDDKRSKFMRDY